MLIDFITAEPQACRYRPSRTKKLSRFLPIMAATILWLSISVRPAPAQTTSVRLPVSSPIKAGRPFPNAQITVVNQDTGFTRRQSTAATGVYTVSDLAPGTYRVPHRRQADSILRRNKAYSLDANHVVTVDVQLTIGSATTQVDVQGTVPIITTETSTTSYVKTDAQLLDTAVNWCAKAIPLKVS